MRRAWPVPPDWQSFGGISQVSLGSVTAACFWESQELVAHPEHWELVVMAVIALVMAPGMYVQSSILNFLCAPAVLLVVPL